MTKTEEKQLAFLKSAMTQENPFNSTSDIIKWVKERNNSVAVSVNQTSFKLMKNWDFDLLSGSLKHESGKFFSIDGINVETNYGNVNSWQQPIINQPEIGYLGFITKEINGILYFLVQAKIEPGNVNNVQLSPTLQATKSNYSQVHKGKKPQYLEYFVERGRCEVLLDQLQSEQGARFLKKRNRNIIIKTSEEITINEDFAWMTLGQIKYLIGIDNLINMDTRTVISGIPLGFSNTQIEGILNNVDDTFSSSFSKGMLLSALNKNSYLNTFDDIIGWFTELKCKFELNVHPIPLNKVSSWVISEDEIFHTDRKYFRIIAANIEISNREVSSWMQPLIEPAQEGLIAFIVKKINGVYHFLIQAKVECGNFDTIEMAPTVQCLTGNYKTTPLNTLPYLDYVLNAKKEQIKIDVIQSEEGGRFYKEQNRNLIIEADENFEELLHPNFMWVSFTQLHLFLKFNNYLNIQARSLISAIPFV
jgi:oxidase EvaA